MDVFFFIALNCSFWKYFKMKEIFFNFLPWFSKISSSMFSFKRKILFFLIYLCIAFFLQLPCLDYYQDELDKLESWKFMLSLQFTALSFSFLLFWIKSEWRNRKICDSYYFLPCFSGKIFFSSPCLFYGCMNFLPFNVDKDLLCGSKYSQKQ